MQSFLQTLSLAATILSLAAAPAMADSEEIHLFEYPDSSATVFNQDKTFIFNLQDLTSDLKPDNCGLYARRSGSATLELSVEVSFQMKPDSASNVLNVYYPADIYNVADGVIRDIRTFDKYATLKVSTPPGVFTNVVIKPESFNSKVYSLGDLHADKLPIILSTSGIAGTVQVKNVRVSITTEDGKTDNPIPSIIMHTETGDEIPAEVRKDYLNFHSDDFDPLTIN